jgi:dimethylglycine dehydrogenase
MLGVDPRRYGSYATKSYLKVKNEEAYANVFVTHFPMKNAPKPARFAPRLVMIG